jgi:hypothetical protein
MSVQDDVRATPDSYDADDKHLLSIASLEGDTRLMWNPANADEVATAQAAFDAARERGMLAYAVTEGGERDAGQVIRTFDPTQAKIIMTNPTQGG